MQVIISGEIVSFLNRTLNIDDAIEERSTCSFTVVDMDGTKHFRKGQPVIITDDDGIRIFAGVIDSVTEEKPGSGSLLYHRIQCVDWHYLADKRIAAKTYENTPAGDIVQDLIDSYLADEGVMGTREQPTFNRDSVAYLSDGTQVAADQPRFEAGKFGQAVMVEEGTTNLLLYSEAFDLWTLVGTPVITSNSTVAPNGATTADTIGDDYTAGFEGIRQEVSITANTSWYTVSIFIKKDTDTTRFPAMNLSFLDSAQASVRWSGVRIDTTTGETYVFQGTPSNVSVEEINGYYRLSYSLQNPGTGVKVRVDFYPAHSTTLTGAATAATTGSCVIWGAQLEQKPYVTSYMSTGSATSTRSPETLTIPTAGVLNPQEGTIEFWWNPLAKTPQTYPSLISTGQWTSPITLDWLSIYWGSGWSNANNVAFVIHNKNGTSNFNMSVALNPQPYTWYYVAAKWSFVTRIAKLIIYRPDGTYVSTQATINGEPPTFEGWDKFYILQTWNNGAHRANSLIDDLRISNRARTDEEIADAYNSGAPLPIDEWTTYKMGMDGSLTAQTPIAEGPSIKQAVINYRPVTEALEALAEKAGFVWYIDAYKVLHFVERAAYSAPWTASGSDMLRNSVSVEQANPKYRNRQYIKGGRDITDPQTETRKGDGNTKSFAMGFPIAKVPTVKVNGATKTVGIKGVDTGKDWYWSKGDPIIVQDESAAALTSSDTLEVTYQGEYDIVVISSDYSAIEDRKAVESGGTGYVEDVADEPDATSRDAAFESANAKLKRYAVIGRRLKFRTKKAGLRPAQLLTVNLPKHELNNAEMLIESVTTYDENGIIFYDITAVEGPEQGSWSKMFALMATRGLAFVERINIGENEILIVLHTVSESWAWAENVTVDVFACPVPSTTLYPSSSLTPC